jgi:histidinol-phosphate/aromatic aminotransferase/cobyric acid decarboxylase-like protein
MNPVSASVRAVTSAPARRAGRAGEIRFIDLETQQARIRDRLDAAIARVLAHGQYIMGPEVAELEAGLSAFCGAPHAVACASGTDALALALMALGVRPAEAILIPAFTFAATAEVVPLLGAVPVFVDVHAVSARGLPAIHPLRDGPTMAGSTMTSCLVQSLRERESDDMLRAVGIDMGHRGSWPRSLVGNSSDE